MKPDRNSLKQNTKQCAYVCVWGGGGCEKGEKEQNILKNEMTLNKERKNLKVKHTII